MTDQSGNSDDEFTIEEIAPDIFLCRERHYASSNVANLYVIRGTRMDLIIDTGVGLWDFAAFLRTKGFLTQQRPHLAVATHVHFDHAGGLHQFEQVGIHRLEAAALEQGDSYEACCFMSDSECAKLPDSTWRARSYKLQATTPTRILEDCDLLDLGDKQIKVLHLPGHSRGSIAFFQEETGILFSGDVVYDGTLYDFLPFSHVPDYVQSFEKLTEMAPRVQRVLPGHGDLFDGVRLKELADEYLEKVTRCYECTLIVPRLFTTFVMKGRNTNEACPRCCYLTCCCHLCV